jgi:sporulation protein YlmC with PRC-barrel domain
MLQLRKMIVNRPVLSLRTGGTIATAGNPIINPDNLKIEGFYCTDRFAKGSLVLLTQDIRDLLPQGYAVNDHDVLTHPEDLVRLQNVLRVKFDVMDKPVYTVNKKRLGKINDYAVDSETLYIQKLYVGQSFLKSLSGGQLSIDRSQIVEITDKKIIVQEPLQGVKAEAASPLSATLPA